MQQKRLLVAAFAIASFMLGAFSYHLAEDITADDVRSAAKIIGLEMTQPEIDSLLPGLDDAREQYAENREALPANSIAPSLVFNPLPQGFELEEERRPPRFSSVEAVSLPEDREELAFYSVGALAELLRSRQISSEELTRFFLDRLREHNDQLQCVITLTEELALEQARRADREIAAGNYRGPLHGIPYGAKDLFATQRYQTTWGAMPYKEQSFDYDATVIRRLEEAGAVLAAKLTLGALAWGDVWYGGKTRNPWDPDTGSSGSSAGSASAVAAGLVPFALGTETLGSIVSPSTVCGTTGLRPTFGRVSRHGAMALVWSMDKIGPLCRTVEDCAIVFDAIYGPDGKDPSVIDAPFNYDATADARAIRVGYLKEAFAGNYGFKRQDSLTLEKMRELGFELIPIELPKMPNLGMILNAESAAAFDELTLSGEDDQLVRQIRNSWPNVFRQARFIPAVEYIQANRLRTQLMEAMQQVFKEVDVYLNPSWGSSSLRITNYTGHPCVVLPNGFQENGRPTSITFTGNLLREDQLLRVAKAYQDATEWNRKHPELK